MTAQCGCGPQCAPNVITGKCYRCGGSYRQPRLPGPILDLIDADLIRGSVEEVRGRRTVLAGSVDLPPAAWVDDVLRDPIDIYSPTSLGEPEGK